MFLRDPHGVGEGVGGGSQELLAGRVLFLVLLEDLMLALMLAGGVSCCYNWKNRHGMENWKWR